ncbi:MAG TPA: hypothetical protein PK530_06955 [Anaerolineales bacterium]|nr:hypothetical protein [Anaerolineales bacterium]
MANKLSRLYRQFFTMRFPPLGYQIGDFVLYDSLLAGFISRYEAGENINIDELPISDLETDQAVASLLSKEQLDLEELKFLEYFALMDEMRRMLLKEPTLYDNLIRQSRDLRTSSIISVPRWVIDTEGYLDLLLRLNHFVVRIDLEPLTQAEQLIQALVINCGVPFSYENNWNDLKVALVDFRWLEKPPVALTFLFAQPELLSTDVLRDFLEIFVFSSAIWAKKNIPFKLICPNTFPIIEHLSKEANDAEILASDISHFSPDIGRFSLKGWAHGRIPVRETQQKYAFPDLLPQHQILCTPEEYLEFFVTPDDYFRKYGKHFSRSPGYIPHKNPNYWKIIPVYEYAECPICHSRITDPGDTYSIRVWGRSYASDLKDSLFGLANATIQKTPSGSRCPHFLGLANFTNLHGQIPDEVDGFLSITGEIPYITPQLLPSHLESYVVLHALPICRIENNQFVPRYTVFVISYFARNPAQVLQRIHDWQNSEGYERYVILDPPGSQSTDLRPWALAGKLGWLDYSQPDLPLVIGRGLTLPPIYQNIQGVNDLIPGKMYLGQWRLKRK